MVDTFYHFAPAHHYWAVLSRSSAAGWLTIWATPPRSVVPPGSTPDSVCAGVGLGQRTDRAVARRLLYAGSEFFCQFGLFLCPADPETFLFTADWGSARTDEPLRAVAF